MVGAAETRVADAHKRARSDLVENMVEGAED